MGNVRLWNMQPIGAPILELVSGTDPKTHPLCSGLVLNCSGGYVQLPPGAYPLIVFKADDRQTPIKTFNVTFKPDTYMTIMVTQPSSGGPLNAEIIDDTPDPTKTASNSLTVRQLIPNVRVQVTVGDRSTTGMLAPGQKQTLDGLVGRILPIAVNATLSNGVVRSWNGETDFSVSRRSTLLVFLDGYGRVRASLTTDGPSPSAEDAVAKDSR